MALSRYKGLSVIRNRDADYKSRFSKRYGDRPELPHLESQILDYPTFEEIKRFQYANHVWSLGDRYYKLANQYYGDSQYWWVIALFNKKPTEQHVEIGDLIKVPLPLNEVLAAYGL